MKPKTISFDDFLKDPSVLKFPEQVNEGEDSIMSKNELAAKMIMGCFHARTQAHLFHLKTGSYAQHVALKEFYDAIVDLADKFAESYQGEFDTIIQDYPSTYTPSISAIAMLTDLLSCVRSCSFDGWADVSQLMNITDEITTLIVSTHYKLKQLN